MADESAKKQFTMQSSPYILTHIVKGFPKSFQKKSVIKKIKREKKITKEGKPSTTDLTLKFTIRNKKLYWRI